MTAKVEHAPGCKSHRWTCDDPQCGDSTWDHLCEIPFPCDCGARADWVQMRGASGNGTSAYVCLRCGAEKTPTIPAEIGAFVAEMQAFQKEHATCPEPF